MRSVSPCSRTLPAATSRASADMSTASTAASGKRIAASTAIFYIGGYINPILAAPVAIGVLVGSFFGAKVLVRTRTVSLRWLFVVALVVIGVEMIYQGVSM